MTTRIHAFTVALSEDMREDDPELVAILKSISLIRGVSGVTTSAVEVNAFAARARAGEEVTEILMEILQRVQANLGRPKK